MCASFCSEVEEAELARMIAEEEAEHERNRKLLHSVGVRVKIGVTLDHRNTLDSDETVLLRPVTAQDSLKQLIKNNPELQRARVISRAGRERPLTAATLQPRSMAAVPTRTRRRAAQAGLDARKSLSSTCTQPPVPGSFEEAREAAREAELQVRVQR